jgi:hypothetical protein
MSDLSPLSGEERKSNFGAAKSVEGPDRTLVIAHRSPPCYQGHNFARRNTFN